MVCLMLEYVWAPFVSAMLSLASLDAEDQSNGFVTGGNCAKISGESSVTASPESLFGDLGGFMLSGFHTAPDLLSTRPSV